MPYIAPDDLFLISLKQCGVCRAAFSVLNNMYVCEHCGNYIIIQPIGNYTVINKTIKRAL